jgi:hypothetical protein
MSTERYIAILFFTSNHAFRAEKVLIGANIACKLVPVPRHLSSECGVCIRIDQSAQESAKEILKTSHVEIDRVHLLATERHA